MAFLKYKHIFQTQKCRFTVSISRPFFFLLLFKKFPHFPQVSNVCSFYTHFWGIFFVASETSVPPFFLKKKKGPPSIAEDLIRYVDDCVTMYLIAATIGGINLKKNVHTQLLLLDTYSVCPSSSNAL